MGNSNVYCDNCNESGGDTPIFFLYNDKKYSGNYLCNNCYINKDKIIYNLITREGALYKQCDNCKIADSNKDYIKIHWNGKFNNKIFCNLCLNDKAHRNKSRK